MASGLPLKDLESTTSSERLIVASNKGEQNFNGYNPDEITFVTTLVRNEDVYDLGGGDFNIPLITTPKDKDLAITETFQVYKYNEITSKFELWGSPELSPSITDITEGTNIDIDYTDPKNPVVSGICAVQHYDTFEGFPNDPENCVLYIDKETNEQYVLGDAWQEVEGISLVIVGTFNDLPVVGDTTKVYLTSDNLETWYWSDGGYVETIFISSGTELPEIVVVDEYVFFLANSTLFVGVANSGYYNISPLASNLFTEDLISTENRTQTLENSDLTFELDGVTSQFKIQRKSTSSYPRLTTEFSDRSSRIQVYKSATEIFGVYIDGTSIVIQTNQDNATINTGNKYLKRDSSGDSTWEDLTAREYSSDVEADADATLPTGAIYAVTGDRTVKRKP